MYVYMYVHVCACIYVPTSSMNLCIYVSTYVSYESISRSQSSSFVIVLVQGNTDTRWQCVGCAGQVQDHRL